MCKRVLCACDTSTPGRAGSAVVCLTAGGVHARRLLPADEHDIEGTAGGVAETVERKRKRRADEADATS